MPSPDLFRRRRARLDRRRHGAHPIRVLGGSHIGGLAPWALAIRLTSQFNTDGLCVVAIMPCMNATSASDPDDIHGQMVNALKAQYVLLLGPRVLSARKLWLQQLSPATGQRWRCTNEHWRDR